MYLPYIYSKCETGTKSKKIMKTKGSNNTLHPCFYYVQKRRQKYATIKKEDKEKCVKAHEN